MNIQKSPHFSEWMLPALCASHQYPDHKIMNLASLEGNLRSTYTPFVSQYKSYYPVFAVSKH
jgi:hypothetical protein